MITIHGSEANLLGEPQIIQTKERLGSTDAAPTQQRQRRRWWRCAQVRIHKGGAYKVLNLLPFIPCYPHQDWPLDGRWRQGRHPPWPLARTLPVTATPKVELKFKYFRSLWEMCMCVCWRRLKVRAAGKVIASGIFFHLNDRPNIKANYGEN